MSTIGHIETSIFWIETDKIVPNPYQPRREFDQDRLKELSDSIRQYGVLQPLVVSRKETHLDDGGIKVEYELIAGERRLRASKLAGLAQVPVVVRTGDDSRAKLELAIIENLQREDLNPVERAQSFQRLADEFKLSWTDVGKKVGKSREYVSNTVRILMLPQDILDALSKKQISEGHTRPLLMLIDRPAEQMTLFKEMMVRKMTVREAEQVARRIAFEKVRKKDLFMTPEVVDMEEKLAETLGTRVQIEPRERGGRIWIDYFSHEELLALSLTIRKAGEQKTHKGMFDTLKDEDMVTLQNAPESPRQIEPVTEFTHLGHTETIHEVKKEDILPDVEHEVTLTSSEAIELDTFDTERVAVDDRSIDEVKSNEQEEDLYNVKSFAL
jgi:ParB family chromosome partitioning protein